MPGRYLLLTSMTATINPNDDEANDLRDLTKVGDVAGAVRCALDEYRRYARRMRLKDSPDRSPWTTTGARSKPPRRMRFVLVDTCIWVQFFNRPQSAEKKAVDACGIGQRHAPPLLLPHKPIWFSIAPRWRPE